MNKEQIFEKLEKVITQERWISPNWEPYAKCSDEEKTQFTLFCDIVGAFAPKSLGTIAVVFEKCDPERQFLIFDPELGHNPEFLSELLKKNANV